MLQAGIIGLPNVGKSTLFNALTRTHRAETANYPFCTIDPNVGVVHVPDARLAPLSVINRTPAMVPAAIEMVDIAGLVAGASKGEGLGNQFLATIREVDAMVHIVRCFEDEDIIHQMGGIDPLRDIEVVATELILADLASLERQQDRLVKKARGHDHEAERALHLIERLNPHLNEMRPAITLALDEADHAVLRSLQLLTAKKILYACNVKEDDLADPEANPHVHRVSQYAAGRHNASSCVISARLEEELVDLSPAEAREYLEAIGASGSGVSQLIQATYRLLGLASFFTTGEKEVRAWTFQLGMKAPQCAGIVHTDFEKGFIKAEIVSYDNLVAAGSLHAARESGKYRLEGKEYAVREGDVILFRFSA